MDKMNRLKSELQDWKKAVKTLTAGEPVQMGETMLYPELQEGQIELDLKSAERMVEICERRLTNAKIKSGRVEITSDVETECKGCAIDGKAYQKAKDEDISDETIVEIFEGIVKPRAARHKIDPIVTIRDINAYKRNGIPKLDKEAKKKAKDADKKELEEIKAKCKELGVSARGGKAKLLANIAEAEKAKADKKVEDKSPLA